MKTSFLTLQGLPIGEPLLFLEVYIMSLNCPYCLSNQVIQVVNGNFETVKENGLVSNWNTNMLLPIAVGLEGEPVSNSITFGCWPGFVFPSWDAHHGQYAMQLTNALDMSQKMMVPALMRSV